MTTAGVSSPQLAHDLGDWFAAKELALPASDAFEVCGRIVAQGDEGSAPQESRGANLVTKTSLIRGSRAPTMSARWRVWIDLMRFRVTISWASAGLLLIASGALAQTPPQPFMPGAAAASDSSSNGPASPKAAAPAAPAVSVEQKPAATAASPIAVPVPAAPAALTPALPSPTAGGPRHDNSPAANKAAPTRTRAAQRAKRAAPRPAARETALSEDPRPTLQSNTFFATAKASERYGAIVDAGGWPTDIVALRPGAKGRAVAQLRRRLSIEGYLDLNEARGEVWDAGLTDAVKRFQSHMGLRRTGVVAGATLKAINVSARVRFIQLASSADRLAGINFPFGDRYVAVNLPATSVEAVENDRVARRYVAIVGDPAHPSPEITAQIQEININPTWTVPSSIIRNEIIPRMQRDPGYLTRAKIQILDGSGKEVDPRAINWSTERAADYTLRQDSGAGNSLGSIRIGMPNKLAVYMHDTPSKRLFGADYRFLSHGCVRVQGVFDLAAWLLQGTGGAPNGVWSKAALEAKVRQGLREDIRLARAVPVIWVYLTGWSNDDGPADFRDDVYGLDSVGEAQASAQPARAAAR